METVTRTYTNPVYSGYLADPFVWEADGEYYAIGTGPLEASGQTEEAKAAASGFEAQLRLFPLLRSDDFVTWHYVSGALLPPDPSLGDTFWAPEVAYQDGTYYLYYSVGFEDKNHQLRVATSTHPQGPYQDIGRPLIDPNLFPPFHIDPSPYQDEDGQWYLFYARDYLDSEGGTYPGTGLAVDRLVDMTTLAGEERMVLRARSDWQRFEAARPLYGQTWDWHTLEAPCVRKHEGRYYCFYSGGRWETSGYGMDYGVADSVLGPYSDAGNEGGPRVLKAIPGHVLGPGGASVALGPDRETSYIVYHAWDMAMTARRLCLDKLFWSPAGPITNGPTWTPQTVAGLIGMQDRL